MKKSTRNLTIFGALAIALTVVAILFFKSDTGEKFREYLYTAAGGGGGGGGTTSYYTDRDGNWTNTRSWQSRDYPGTTIDADEIAYINHDINMNDDIEVKGQLIINSAGELGNNGKKLKVKDGGSVTVNGALDVKELEIEEGSSLTSTATITVKNKLKIDEDCSATFGGPVVGTPNCELEIKDNSTVTFNDTCSFKKVKKIENSTATFNGGIYVKDKVEKIKGSTVVFDGNCYFKGEMKSIENNSTVTFQGTTTFKKKVKVKNSHVKFKGTATIEDDLEIEEDGGSSQLTVTGTLTVEGDFDNDGAIDVKSSSVSTGVFNVQGSSSGSKTITFYRYIRKEGWHYISSPVHNSSTDVFWGGAIYAYDESTGSWTAISAGQTMPDMKGYDVYYQTANHTITFTGTMNEGSVSMSLTKDNDGYNMVGNPYPATIDWQAGSGWTKTNINDAVYIWDDTTQNTMTFISGVGTNGGTRYIPPTMAFFVKCNNASGGTLAMTDDVKVGQSVAFRSSSTDNMLRLTLQGEKYADETVIKFTDDASEVFDPEQDAQKFFSYNVQVPQIYTKLPDYDVAINAMPATLGNIDIPLFINTKVAGEYTIKFDFSDDNLNMNVLLEDLDLNKTTDLQSDGYTFESKQVLDYNRFVIHFIPAQKVDNTGGTVSNNTTTGMEDEVIQEFNIWSVMKVIYIDPNPDVTDGDIYVHDLNGREVIKQKYQSNSKNQILVDEAPGYYIVSIIKGNQKLASQKVLIR